MERVSYCWFVGVGVFHNAEPHNETHDSNCLKYFILKLDTGEGRRVIFKWSSQNSCPTDDGEDLWKEKIPTLFDFNTVLN